MACPVAAGLRDRTGNVARDYRVNESGAGTVLSMLLVSCTLLLVGLAIDTGNAWRNREILKLSADVAAHAGISAIARGDGLTNARKAAIDAIGWNDAGATGPANASVQARKVDLMHYDEASGTLSPDGPINAMRVALSQTTQTGNAVPTFLLKLVGVPSWDVRTSSTSVLLPTQRCSNAEGLFAQGPISFQTGARIGADYCVHSQTTVDLGLNTDLLKGARISVPDLAACKGGCSAYLHPGIDAAAINLQLPDFAVQIKSIYDGFSDPNSNALEKADFFATRPLDPDLSPLEEMMIDTDSLDRGSIVVLTPMEFTKMRSFPSGLIYSVTCNAGLAPSDTAELLPVGGMMAVQTLRNIALVTNCAIIFDPLMRLDGSLILTTYVGNMAAFSADAGAMAVDPAAQCGGYERQSTLMALGKFDLPAGFLTSRTAVVAAGDFELRDSAKPALLRHVDLTIHAGGALRITGRHEFVDCGQQSVSILPSLQVIRQVMTRDATALPYDTPVIRHMPSRLPAPVIEPTATLRREDVLQEKVRHSPRL